MIPRIVIDTNVFLSALRSRNDASFKLISLLDENKFEVALSVPLVIEYETVAKRQSRQLGLSHQDIDDILDYICSVGIHRSIHFLWRPYLRDPKDDLVLEIAVESESDYIVTYNIRDFQNLGTFSLEAITAKQFLEVIGEIQ